MSAEFAFDAQRSQIGFIRFAQQLAGMIEQDDIWRQTGQAIFHFFDADLVGFLNRSDGGHWRASYWSLPPNCTEEDVFTPAVEQTAAKVLESSFMASESMDLNGTCQVALFPVMIENRRTAIMIIGHAAEEPIARDLLSLYMGVAGLVGETVTRALILARLRQDTVNLQQLITGNSGNLAAVNKDLNQANSQLNREITQRQRIEQALQEAEREKAAILNGLQEVEVLLLDPEMRIIWTNAGSALPSNRRDEDFRGRYCYQALQGRDAPCPDCTAKAACSKGCFQEGEITLPDGRSMLTRSNPLKNEQGKIISVIHVAVDITRRKMMERALIEREARLRNIVENALEIIYTLTPEGMISYASPRWTQLIGHESPDLVGRSFVSFLHPSDRTAFQSYFAAAAAGDGQNQRIEFRMENRNGLWRWYGTTLSAVKDSQGRLKEFVGIAEDNTDRKHSEEELRKAKEAAEAATLAKTEFLTNMSHEIRTPMTAILGFAEMLLESIERPQDVVAANTIKRNGEYLLRIINDILDLSKIETGHFVAEQAKCSPRELIDDVVSMMKVRADAKGLPLLVEFVGPIPQTIRTDPIRMRQILINLIGNAVKFTEEGHICIQVRLAENDRKEPLLECKIIDTGIGMSEEQINRLFEPFTQGDASTSRKYVGMGLGLALSKRLAGMLGGNIAFSSVKGQGSTFAFTLGTGSLEGVHMLQIDNTLEDQPASLHGVTPPVLQHLSGRILLAEDGLDNQRLLALILRKAGATVTIVNNGKEALEKVIAEQKKSLADGIQTPPFDVILMDMQMPEMDGYEATWRLREMGYTAPIIALTAHAMNHDREKCLSAGCDEYLTKPIDREILFSTILRYMSEEHQPLQEVQAWII
ncbi:MAG: PAS domain-containing protein [Thermoguttaceae bacterium]|jgi:PAS domain S-box-containing protein